jgi:hypothetical protein
MIIKTTLLIAVFAITLILPVASSPSGIAGTAPKVQLDGALLVTRVIAAELTPSKLLEARSAVDLVVGVPRSLNATLIDTDSAELPGYSLRVTRSSDRRHFQVSLQPHDRCGMAWFGNDSQTIYSGKALGCPR